MDNVLADFLDSKARAKLLRLFFANQGKNYDLSELKKISRLKEDAVKKELRLLLRLGIVKALHCEREKISRGKPRKVKSRCFAVNESFKYFRVFKQFVINIDPTDESDILSKFKKVGPLKALVLAGVFLHDDDSRLDLLIVADKVQEKRLQNAIADMESQLGKEIKYADMSSEEFKYRLSMRDRLLRDLFESNHKVILDKLKLAYID